MRRLFAFTRRARGPARTVVLYETRGCGLCAEALARLSRIARDTPLRIERVDIGSDGPLFDRYGLRVPVLIVDGRELDAAGLNENALRRFVMM